MENSKDIELIEKYLNNELSQTEKDNFDSRLQADAELAAEFERHENAHAALDYMITKNLKQQLLDLESQEKVVSIHRTRNVFVYRLAAAASVLLLVGFFYFRLMTPGSLTGNELATKYYELPGSSLRGGAGEVEYSDSLLLGLEAYEKADYPSSIHLLESIPPTDRYYVLAQFYLGHALFQSKEFKRAEQAFSNVIAGKDIRLAPDAEWFDLLTCLAQDLDCYQKLDILVNDTQHAYHHQAVEIKKQLQ